MVCVIFCLGWINFCTIFINSIKVHLTCHLQQHISVMLLCCCCLLCLTAQQDIYLLLNPVFVIRLVCLSVSSVPVKKKNHDTVLQESAQQMQCNIGCMVSGTYTRQLRSAKSSIKSNNWLMSYVIEGLFGFILFRCSSYILQTPRRCWRVTGTKSKFAQ